VRDSIQSAKVALGILAAATGAEASSLYVSEPGSTTMSIVAATGPSADVLTGLEFPTSVGLAGHTISTGEVVETSSAQTDRRWNPDVDRQTHFVSKQILTVPVRTDSGVTLGAIQVINTQNDQAFQKRDIDIALLAARALAETYENSLLRERAEVVRPYLHPEVLRLSQTRELQQIRGREVMATVLLTDLAGFTRLTAELGPVPTADFLNRHFSLVAPILRKHGGLVDSYTGDGVLGVFAEDLCGVTHAKAALLASVEIQRSFAVSPERVSHPWLGLRLGIATGPVYLGPLGSPDDQRLSVIGDAVNLAKHIQESVRVGAIGASLATMRAVSGS